MKYQKKQKAFSLIEISVVIVIIGILIAGITQGSRLLKVSRLSSAQSLTMGSPVNAITKNLVIWLEPTLSQSFKNQNNSFEIEDGDTVSSWIDNSPISTNKVSVDQSTILDQPKYVADGINGLPSIRLNSTNQTQRLISRSIMNGKNVETTYFVVFKWNDSSISLTQEVIDFGAQNTLGEDMSHLLYVATGPNVQSVSTLFWNGHGNESLKQSAANFIYAKR